MQSSSVGHNLIALFDSLTQLFRQCYTVYILFCREFSKNLNLIQAIEHDKHIFSAKSGEID